MEVDAMVGTEKLGKKVSRSEKKKKSGTQKISPRNPLTELNIPSIPPLQTSTEALRRGCFRFLRPSSSSKEDSSLRSKCKPHTPKSAPPISRTLSSKAIPNDASILNKNCSKFISENPPNVKLKNLWKPNTPDLLHKWNLRRPNLRELTSGKITEPEAIFKADFMKKNGSFVDSARERAITPEGIKPSSEEKEVKQQLSATPRSNSTPPIQSSISPEVPCPFSVAPTPICYATGHVMAGVQDRRKCRPRGILTIGEEQSNVSRVSSAPPPLAKASVCWFSSPIEIGNGSIRDASSPKVRFDFPDEASVNWLPSPADVLVKDIESGSVKGKSSFLDAEFGLETTPSSCPGILRTPTSNSSVSPFSVIVQRAEASSRLQILNSHKKKGGYINGDALDVIQFSEKSWTNRSDVSTPSSHSNSRPNGVIVPLDIESAREDLGAMGLSSRPVLGNYQNGISPLHSLSFKFGCQPTATPLNSIDMNCFESSRCDELSKVELGEKNLSASGERISWREGLFSRIFEMGELDSYHSFFDDNENVDYAKDGYVKSDINFKFAMENGSSAFEKGNGFGSYEFAVYNDKIDVQKCQSEVLPLEPSSFAESISTEGGLISSGDSDWTLFYKNNLFEV